MIMKIDFSYFANENDELETEVSLPAKWEICSACRGEGTHVNRAIDGHGITAEEWENDWSYEEREGYHRGDYDVACEAGCKDGKALVVDDQVLMQTEAGKKLLELYYEENERAAQYDYEDAQIRRMENGGY